MSGKGWESDWHTAGLILTMTETDISNAVSSAVSPRVRPDSATGVSNVEIKAPQPTPAPSVDELQTKNVVARASSAADAKNVEAEIQQALEKLKSLESAPNNLRFSIDDVSDRIMVTITDEKTGKVVRQLPSEAILRVAHNIESLKGVLFDELL